MSRGAARGEVSEDPEDGSTGSTGEADAIEEPERNFTSEHLMMIALADAKHVSVHT